VYLARQSIKVIKTLMRNGETTQQELSDQTGVSIGQVNKTVTKLKCAFLANVDSKRGVKLVDEERLLLAIGAEAPIQSTFRSRYYITEKKVDSLKKIAHALDDVRYAFTLLPAVAVYSAVAAGEILSIYIIKSDLSKGLPELDRLGTEKGIPVEVFEAHEGILYDKEKRKNAVYVSNEQLIIDLFRTPQFVYLGMQVLNEFRKARSHG